VSRNRTVTVSRRSVDTMVWRRAVSMSARLGRATRKPLGYPSRRVWRMHRWCSSRWYWKVPTSFSASSWIIAIATGTREADLAGAVGPGDAERVQEGVGLVQVDVAGVDVAYDAVSVSSRGCRVSHCAESGIGRAAAAGTGAVSLATVVVPVPAAAVGSVVRV
jgi:hypothetical protein